MPTNLPPEAQKAEDRYRAASTPEERIVRLEEFISLIPKHKGTDKLRADLRKRLSKLRSSAQSGKGAARHVSPYHIKPEGAGQVVVIGPPNSGKSALVTALTNVEPEVAPYPFSTWGPTPGMMPIDNVQVQLIDLPPLHAEHIEPDMIELIRRADLALLVIDLQGFPIEGLHDTLALLRAQRILPAHQASAEATTAVSEKSAVPPPRFTRLPMLFVANKCDDAACDEDFEVLGELLGETGPLLPVSAVSERHLDELRQAVFGALGIMRVYAKPPHDEPDRSAPFVLPKGSTVEEFAAAVHQDFVTQLKIARIWGSGVFDGQSVGRDHVLHDEDVVELHI